MDSLQEAREYLSAYQYRINQDNYRGDLESRTRYENCAYQEGMLQAAIAQAEAMQLIAKRLEQWMETQGVGFEVIEAAERGLRYKEENETLTGRIAELEAKVLRLKGDVRTRIEADLMARGESRFDG